MGFINQFPYSDAHELNLDWVISEVKKCSAQIESFTADNRIKFANPIQWDITKQYEAYTVVSDLINNRSYLSVKPVPSGIGLDNTNYWTLVGLFNVDPFLSTTSVNPVANRPVAQRFNLIDGEIANIENDVTANRNAIIQETFDRTSADNTINTRIDNVSHDIALEAAAREGEDTLINARIDNLIIADPADAELADIRTGYNGIVYASAGDAVRGQVSDINEYNVTDLFVGQITRNSSTEHDVSYTWSGKSCTVNGTADGISAKVLRLSTALPYGMTAESEYYVKYQTTSSDVKLRIIFRDSSDATLATIYCTGDQYITVPASAAKMTIALYVASGKTINNAVVSEIACLDEETNTDIVNKINNICSISRGVIPTNTDFDSITAPGSYVIQGSNTYTNCPLDSGSSGTLIVFPSTANTTLQIVIGQLSGILYNRTSSLGVFPATWNLVEGGNVNTFITQNYENTYNIACSPEITADTNNYLASTGDTTDRTADIQAMLSATGVCHLGPGLFIVSGIDIPSYASLIGSGNSTMIRLNEDVSTGYAIKLQNQSSVSKLRVSGSLNAPTLSSTVGTRHGIVFTGNFTPDNPSGTTYRRSMINEVVISNFTGSGILCSKTGTPYNANLLISDVFILQCNAGINIDFYSEFHRISNCAVTGCYYGCIDNGGNNNFSNCDFSGNRIGIFIDNSTDQSVNNSHGTFSGCSINHSFSDGGVMNEGTAIKLLKANLGEIFTGLQVFYGSIELDECIGIRFNSCNIGSDVPITITDSTVVTFTDCTFKEAPDSESSPVTQSGNTALVFTGCYLRNGTAYDPIT